MHFYKLFTVVYNIIAYVSYQPTYFIFNKNSQVRILHLYVLLLNRRIA